MLRMMIWILIREQLVERVLAPELDGDVRVYLLHLRLTLRYLGILCLKDRGHDLHCRFLLR